MDLFPFFTKCGEEIKSLNFSGNEFEDPTLLSLMPLPNLEKLDLSNNKITDIKFLIKMDLSKLKELKLDGNKLSKNKIDALAQIKNYDKILVSVDNQKIS